MKYYFTKELYNKDALLKAAYYFTDVAYLHLDADSDNYIVNIEMKECKEDSAITESDFQNEILAQMIRQKVYKETKHVRELMIARAFSSTIIEKKENDYKNFTDESCENMDTNDILKDWFEKYE